MIDASASGRLRLRYSPTSPFVRKVMVFLHETGLRDRVDLVPTDAWSPETDLRQDTPLCKVPALILPDGTVMPESTLICDTLDHLHDGPRLFPEGPARVPALRLLALGDGVITACVVRIIEGRYRTTDDKQAWWLGRQTAAIAATLDLLEAEAAALAAAPLSIGPLTIAVALSYLSFRFPGDAWAETRPALAAWHEDFCKRPSMVATQPPAA
ncbi:glutathione S-transferase [Pararhodospirillum oryzae]|uniref:Glutathione S-transferase n=1 Tax=Pararhodospirillum oryzae TaxID=478448 RepID=A0A512HA39_9PROT|nr:glutathione S-transferase [Pararhodospirillum oryzae]GEO82321.1 glutathione S-transferase [Pararhodospirillum oryzae]